MNIKEIQIDHQNLLLIAKTFNAQKMLLLEYNWEKFNEISRRSSSFAFRVIFLSKRSYPRKETTRVQLPGGMLDMLQKPFLFVLVPNFVSLSITVAEMSVSLLLSSRTKPAIDAVFGGFKFALRLQKISTLKRQIEIIIFIVPCKLLINYRT